MKKYISLFLALWMIVFHYSCNSELETSGSGTTTPEVVFETTENANLAVNGLALLMSTQYLESQGFNGEGTIKMWYGEYPGNNFVKDLTGWSVIINSQYLTNVTSIYLYYPWYYYYKIIGDANYILEHVDAAEGPDADKLAIKAQALTFRAYSFFMMSQLYCNRWSDSNNGASRGLILRLNTADHDNTDLEFSSLADTYKRVYDDLDTAIDYFEESGFERSDFWQTDADVAKAIYARAALTKEDFATAATMAKEARENYPLMNTSDLTKGFFESTSEWIWGSYGGTEQNLYYYSYQSYMAYNTSASIIRSYPNMITKELYAKIPTTDVRRDWWVYPGDDTTTPGLIANGSEKDTYIRKNYPEIQSNARTANYMQFKIGCKGLPGVGNTCHIRSSELLLIEAEALLRQSASNEGKARDLLVELNKTSERDPSYATTKTGNDLLEEIYTYRSIELWGEGFDWFDHKRTGRSIARTSRSSGGSYLAALAITLAPDGANSWTWEIPQRETDYNESAKLWQPEN